MKPHIKSIYHSLASGIIISLLIISPAWAKNETWTGAVDNLWTTNGNWSDASAPGGNINGILIFDNSDAVDQTVTAADGAYTGIKGINFNGAEGGFSISGLGSFSIKPGSSVTGNGALTHNFNNIGFVSNGGPGFTFGGTDSYTIGGVISGTSITQSSSGTLTLTGNNTFDNGNSLNAGTIVLGHDNALGTGTLTVSGGDGAIQSNNDARSVDNAITINGQTLTVSGASNLTLSGVIADGAAAGALTKSGNSTLTLSGNNTYSGGTTLNANSMLILGHNSALGTGTLALGGDGTIQSDNDSRSVTNAIAIGGNALTVSGSSNLILSGVISGAGGTLTKSGSGTLTLSGNNTYDGLTTLSAGPLTLGGQAAGALTVTAGTLNGDGTIGDTLTLNGGTFAPGSSIGTMTIQGNYVQNPGSTVEVEVEKTSSGNLRSDLLDVGGSATFEAGSTISVTDLSSSRLIGTGDTFTIVQTGSGVTDNGATITSNSAVLSFAGLISSNNYQLVATREALALNVSGGNNSAVLGAIDSDVGTATGDYVTLINALTALNSAQLNNAAEKLNPLPHASATLVSTRTTQRMAGNLANYLRARRSGIERIMMLNTQSRQGQLLIADASSDSRMLAHVINDNKRIAKRQQKEMDSKIRGFFRPFGLFYDHDSTPKMTGFRAKAVGAQFGFDKSFGPNLIMGIGGGYSNSFINFKESRGEGDVDSFRVGPYATHFRDDFFIDTSVTFGYHENENKRNIKFGTINRTADSDYHAYDLSAYIGGGYDFHVNEWTVTPTASLQYICYRNESFKETGAGAAGLDVDAATSHSLRSKLGVTLSTVTELYETKVVPELFVGWAHGFIDNEDIEARFVEGTAKFTTGVDDDWDDSVYFGAGISALLKENISVFVSYKGEYSSGNIINALNVGMHITF